MRKTLSFHLMFFVGLALPDDYELKPCDDDKDGTNYSVVLKSNPNIQVATISLDGMTVNVRCGGDDEKAKNFANLFSENVLKKKPGDQENYAGFLNRKVHVLKKS